MQIDVIDIPDVAVATSYRPSEASLGAMRNYYDTLYDNAKALAIDMSLLDASFNKFTKFVSTVNEVGLQHFAFDKVAAATLEYFTHLPTLQDIQLAPPHMHQYLLANPVVHAMHRNGECFGFTGSTEINMTNPIGFGNVAFMEATSGMIDPVTGDTNIYFGIVDDVYTDFDKLSPSQKFQMADMWGTMIKSIENGIDPTSPFGAGL